jgi:hypothetical protein
MENRFKTTILWGILIYSLAGNELINAMVIPVQESDVVLTVGVGPTSYNLSLRLSFSVAVSDFDGDGFDDVAWGYTNALGTPTDIFPGLNLPKKSTFNDVVRWRFFNGDMRAFGDYDGDGRSDLVAGVSSSESSYSSMVLSKAGNDGPWDFTHPGEGLKLGGSVSLGLLTALSGDLTGDGIGDLVASNFTASSAGRVYNGMVSILPGRSVWPASFDWSLDPSSKTILGATSEDRLGNPIEGDINKDGRVDLVLNSYSGIYVIFGSSSLPKEWDLAVKPANCWVGPGGTDGPRAYALGDVNKDGRADLIFKWANKIYLLDGALIANHISIDLTPGSPTEQPILFVDNSDSSYIQCADFDGDGRSDLIIKNQPQKNISIHLTSSYSTWPAFPSSFIDPALRITSNKELTNPSMGDLNNDGHADIVFAEFWGLIYVVYGFKPLTRPSLVVGPPEVETTRVSVTLSVDGDPTEMKFSGNLTDTFKDQWIPFQTAKTITLSSLAGEKTLNVRFRNVFGRESETATGVVTLQVEDQRAEVANNLVTADQPALVECRMNTPGNLKAYVLSHLGQKIVDVMDLERGIGVWPVEWNGTNSEGRRVAPGVYVLIMEFGGQQTRTKVLVRD